MQNSAYIAVAKFYVAEVRKYGYPHPETTAPVITGIKVVLRPVSYKPNDPTHENSAFWTASPSGEMTLDIQNTNIFDRFEVGREVYLPMLSADAIALSDLSGALHALPLKEKIDGSESAGV